MKIEDYQIFGQGLNLRLVQREGLSRFRYSSCSFSVLRLAIRVDRARGVRDSQVLPRCFPGASQVWQLSLGMMYQRFQGS